MISTKQPDLVGHIERIDGATSLRHLKTALVDFLPRFQIQHAAYCGVPPLGESNTQQWLVLVTYPDSWVRHYMIEDYFRIDPVVQSAMRDFMPIDWRDLKLSNPLARQILTEALDYGIGRQGLAFPIRGASGDFALFNVTADLDDAAWDGLKAARMSDWQTLGFYLHRRLLEIAGHKIFGGVTKLSPRETQTLQLTARGMHSDEVAADLGISERVVRAHLQTCRYKLNALNTTHAVARAIKLRLIQSD